MEASLDDATSGWPLSHTTDLMRPLTLSGSMQPTRRLWALVGVGVTLLGVSLLSGHPLPLVGAAVVGGFCLVSASRAVSAFTATDAGLSARVQATPERLPAGGETALTVVVSSQSPLTHPVTVDAQFPPGVDVASLTLAVPAGETSMQRTVTMACPIAGRFDCPPLRCTLESPGGFFTETLPRETDLTLTVESAGTGPIHVGAGGTARGAFGSHRSEATGAHGVDISTLREYEFGDSIRRIDWKATARLDEPHVREYEVELEQPTRLVVDARSHLLAGPAGRTKLDVIRDVALGVLRQAETGNDPVALTLVDDAGIRVTADATGTTDQYQRIRETLLQLGPDTVERRSRRMRTPVRTGPADARRAQEALRGRADDSPFGRTLAPFFTRSGSYVATLADEGLFEAVRRHVREASHGAWTVLITDDSDPGRLMEATKLATRGNGRATVFVTPSAVFGTDALADPDRAYDDLVDFERLRRRLQRLPRVTAYEVAPDSRLRAVLAQGSAATHDRRPPHPVETEHGSPERPTDVDTTTPGDDD